MECNKASGRRQVVELGTGLCLLLLLGVVPNTQAQISDEGNSHRQELRYSLREAKEIETVYNQTHLNLDERNFKKGESSRKRLKGKENPGYNKKIKRKGKGSRISLNKLFRAKN